jgi:putative ABC transport system permease protein
MQMELIAGRNFDPLLASDTTHAVIVNETFVQHFGWTEPVGEVVSGLNRNPADDPVVIGVVKDYNFLSLHQEVGPVMLSMNPQMAGINDLLVRIESDAIPATLDILEATWADFSPELPFQYSFLNDDLHQYYQAEQRWSRIVGYSTLFAILIASLGLFGLAALSAAGRTKEVGIRKVMGASVAGLTMLLTRDFAKLVAIGVLLATPPAYWAIQRWLEEFAYRIDLSWSLFGLAGLLALGIAILTVGYQSVKAALGNPVDALRYE